MAYGGLTLSRGADRLDGWFRDDGDGRAHFEGAFVVAKGDRLAGADGDWIVWRVKQLDVAGGQTPYAWAELKRADGEARAPEPVAEDADPEEIASEDEPEAEAPEAEPEPAPVAEPRKPRKKKADDDAD